MLNISLNIENRKRMEAYVDHCELKNPDEVARLFLEYTLLIWDYLLVGRIADFYTDDIVMNHANGLTIQGLDNVYSGTLGAIATCPEDNETIFIDIFAEGNPEDGYSFIQATTAYRPSKHGGAPYQKPEGKMVSDEQNGSIGLCECLVKKVDGKWRIVQEWLVRSPAAQPKQD